MRPYLEGYCCKRRFNNDGEEKFFDSNIASLAGDKTSYGSFKTASLVVWSTLCENSVSELADLVKSTLFIELAVSVWAFDCRIQRIGNSVEYILCRRNGLRMEELVSKVTRMCSRRENPRKARKDRCGRGSAGFVGQPYPRP